MLNNVHKKKEKSKSNIMVKKNWKNAAEESFIDLGLKMK
jgi:hypothetical protein